MNIWKKPIPDKRCPVQIGEKVTFTIADDLTAEGMPGVRAKMRVGRVCEINEDHRWFAVEYKILGRNNAVYKLREAFKFEDFGKAVQHYGK